MVGILVFFLLYTPTGRALLLPEAEEERKALRVERLKKKVASLGTGRRSQVAIKLMNGASFLGYIDKNWGDALDMVNGETGEKANISFAKIRKINLFHVPSPVSVVIVLMAVAIGLLLLTTLVLALHIG